MSSRRKPPTFDYAQPSQMSVLARLEPFSWLVWVIGGAAFLAVFGALAENAFSAALLELFLQLPLLLAWIVAAYGWGCLVRLRVTGALEIVTRIALGLGGMSLVVLGLGLISALNRPVSFAMILGGVAITVTSIVRAKPTLTARVPLAHAVWLAVVPMVAIVALCALLPAGLLWGMDEPNGYDVVGYHLQVPREWYEAGRISGLHHNVYSYFPFNVEMHYLLAMHLMGGPWKGQFLAQLMHGVYVALSVVAVYAAVRDYGRGRAIAAALLAAAPPWMPLLGSIAYNEGGLLLYGTLAIAWTMRFLTPSPGIPAFGSEAQARRGEGGVGVLPRDESTSPIQQNPHPTLSRNTGRGTELAIAGVMAGLAAGCKLTAVPILLVGLPVAMLIVSWRAWKGVAVFVIAGVLTFSPWLIRNAVWTGNPVFPEMQSILGRGHFSEAQSQRWHKAHKPRPDQQTMSVRVGELGRQVFTDWRFAYVLVPLGIVAMLLAIRRREGQMLLILIAILTTFWLTQTHLQGRFYVLAIPIAAMAVAIVPWRPWLVTVATLAGIAVIAGTIMLYNNLWSVNLYYIKRGVGLMDAVGFTGIDRAAGIAHHDPTLLVALVGDAQAYLYQLPMSKLHYRSVFDVNVKPGQDVFDAWMEGLPSGMRVIRVIDQGELFRFHRTYGIPLRKVNFDDPWITVYTVK